MNFHDRSNLASAGGWSDERVELLKKLWADGLSALQIAAELGGVTRNGVIGKVHRIGLSGRIKSPSGGMRKPRKAGSAGGTMRPPRSSMRAATSPAIWEPEPELIVIPFAQRKTLLQLTEKTCHWPVGDPASEDFFYCGGESLDDSSYCAFHHRVAHQPMRDRRRERPFKHGYVRSL